MVADRGPTPLAFVLMKSATHAGTVVYRHTGSGYEYLVVTAKRDPSKWVLPKGHIDPGESPEQAAVREALEEAGAVCRIKKRIGRSVFDQRGVKARVDFYLAELEKEVEAEEDREIRWYPLEAAIKRLSFDNLREILRKAEQMID